MDYHWKAFQTLNTVCFLFPGCVSFGGFGTLAGLTEIWTITCIAYERHRAISTPLTKARKLSNFQVTISKIVFRYLAKLTAICKVARMKCTLGKHFAVWHAKSTDLLLFNGCHFSQLLNYFGCSYQKKLFKWYKNQLSIAIYICRFPVWFFSYGRLESFFPSCHFAASVLTCQR